MGREGGGVSKDKSKQLAVVNERLIRECIYVAPPPGVEDDSKSRFSGALGFDKTSERADAKRQQVMSMELHHVTCLMCGFKGISRIANFVGVDNLTKLYLDNNRITTIENLGHLKKLQWLDLSFNQISVIEGLDQLTQLEDLSLYANEVSKVQNLETLTKLACLSLGKNKIDQLEETATYLHGFRTLRMLTLAGNKIAEQGQYKQKLLAYVPDLKYLDSRLVFKHEVKKAQDDLSEHLNTVAEADKKVQEAIDKAAVLAEEDAKYARANAPNEEKLLHEITYAHEPPDGRSIRVLLEMDTAKDKLKDVVDEHKEGFSSKAKELAEKMKEIRRRKDREHADFTDTLEFAKSECDEGSKQAIRRFEEQLHKVIPFALRASPDPRVDYADSLTNLRQELDYLKGDLLEYEADQADSYEEVIKAYEEQMVALKTEAVETLNASFEALRTLERDFYNSIKLKLDSWHEQRQTSSQDAQHNDLYEGGNITSNNAGASSKEKQVLMQMLDSKDDYAKTMSEWYDARIRRLEENNEALAKNEEAQAKGVIEANKEEDHRRNRSRVSEIHAYVDRVRGDLDAWENDWLEPAQGQNQY